jgi:hypothetical protein
MMRYARVFSMLVIAVILTLQHSIPVAPAVRAQEPSKGVQPLQGPAGTEFAFFATGFEDKEKLGYWFHAPDGTLYQDNNYYRVRAYEGRVDWTWRVPHNAMTGTWTAVIEGIRSKNQVTISFDVIAYDPEAATAQEEPVSSVVEQNASPTEGPPGTLFSFYAHGFNESEQVAYWFTDPAGTIISEEPNNIIHSHDGRVDWSWQSPSNAMSGTWIATVHGRESGVQRVVYFDIYLPPGVTPTVTASDEPPRSTETAVSPLVGEAGTEFAFFARGFDHLEKVGYWFNAPDGTIYENKHSYVAIANNDRADWSWTSPENAPKGIWTVVARGATSKTERTIQFEIGNPNNPTIGANAPSASNTTRTNSPDVAVEPAQAHPGARFAFSAAGFPPGETISFWATDPLGQRYEDSEYVIKSNEEGVAYWDWKTPDDAISGTWSMIARGDKGFQQVIYFAVYDPNAEQSDAAAAPPVEEMLNLPHGVNSPYVAVEPLIARPGERFSFSAQGFPHRAKVIFWAVDPSGEVHDNDDYTLRANKEGTAYWNWKSPVDAVEGVWEMHASHNISDFEQVVYFEIGDPEKTPSVTFYAPQSQEQPVQEQPVQEQPVQEQPAQEQPAQQQQPVELPTNSSDVAVDPLSDYAGARFAFKAAGYPARETVYYWAVDPAGQKYEKSEYSVMSDQEGVAYWNWKTPEEATPGVWQMHVVGDKSPLEHVIYFEVLDRTVAETGNTEPSVQPTAAVNPETDTQSSGQSQAGDGPLPNNSAQVAVEPRSDVIGARFHFKAGGYPPREKVHFWVVDPEGQEYRKHKYEVKSDEAGVAYWNWKTPEEDAVPGIWAMHALGDKSLVKHVIYFQVVDPSAPAGSNVAPPASNTQPTATPQPAAGSASAGVSLDIAVDPPGGMAGDRFAFFATGYPSREKVYYWAVAPDGTKYDNSKYETLSNMEGRADWTWKTPEDAQPGIWTMYALGDKSRLQRQISFEIYP